MMARRLYMDAGRMVVSRPGFTASPTTPNSQKIFDSDWGYSGTLIASGEVADPAPFNFYDAGGSSSIYNQRRSVTLTSGNWTIPIPTVGYIPTLWWGVETKQVGTAQTRLYYQQYFTTGNGLGLPTIADGLITITRPVAFLNYYTRLGIPWGSGIDGEGPWEDMKFVYHVFGF